MNSELAGEALNKRYRAPILFCLALLILGAFVHVPAAQAEPRASRVLKFSGVPISMATVIKKQFPFVFEREVNLAEIDQLVRFLMQTGAFSNVEVLERDNSEGGRETILVASLLRRISGISVRGNKVISSEDVVKTLAIQSGQAFERKNLLAAADELRLSYQRLGYHNAKVEIEFQLPNDNEVKVDVSVSEGAPLIITEALVEVANKDLSRRLGRIVKRMKKKVLNDDLLAEFQKNAAEELLDANYLLSRVTDPAVSLNPARTQAKLVYTIENPWRVYFRFTGNSFFSNSAIIDELKTEKLAGATASPAPDMAEKIRRLYQTVGFANVEVSHSEEKIESSFKYILAFKINENPRVRIKKIEIAGNVSKESEYYAHFIKSSSSDLIGQGFYNNLDIEEGSKKLVTELQNQGYLKAKVQATRAEYSNDKTAVTIFLTIEEGPLTNVQQIRLEGVEAFPKAQILDLLKVKTGAALSLKDLEDSLRLLKEFYLSQGFLEMRILNENERNRVVLYNEGNTQATIELQIREGPKVTVSSIVLQGNSFTKSYVLEREIAFKPGDTLTPEKINETVFRLQQLGLFSRVSVRTLEEGTSIAERTAIIEVDEANPGLFTFGLGVNNEHQFTFRSYLGISYRNLAGSARGLSFRVDPQYSIDPRISYVEHKVTISYLEPYIFGDRNRGRVNLVRDVRFSGEFTKQQTAIMQEENSIGLLLERDLTRHVKLTYTGYSLANQSSFDRATYQTLNVTNIAKTGPLIEIDYRNDTFNPSKGSFSLLNLEYADPFLGSSDDSSLTVQFIKTNASYTRYDQLSEKGRIVWANSIRGGYVANVSTKPTGGVPSQEAFFLGGRSTIRGFDSGDLERIPNRLDLNTADYTNFRVQNNSTFALFKTELRFPIYKNLGGAVFYDGGAVLIAGFDLPDPYRDSVGFGVRYGTPVGPVNLEIGWKLDRRLIRTGDPDIRESPFAIHFSIGTF